ncbi:MAG: hypothetical protein Q9225_000370 [Loekoesia sp. 1 TL-2023]
MANCQYDPVKMTKVMKRPKKMVTKMMLVRSAQTKNSNERKPMESSKKPGRKRTGGTYEEIVRAQGCCAIAAGTPPTHQLACEGSTAQQEAKESHRGWVGEGASQITLDRLLRGQIKLLEQFFHKGQQSYATLPRAWDVLGPYLD